MLLSEQNINNKLTEDHQDLIVAYKEYFKDMLESVIDYTFTLDEMHIDTGYDFSSNPPALEIILSYDWDEAYNKDPQWYKDIIIPQLEHIQNELWRKFELNTGLSNKGFIIHLPIFNNFTKLKGILKLLPDINP